MRVSWIAALCLLVWATGASARPYTLEDMLALEGFGQVQIDPDEHWAVIEHRRAWTSASRFDLGFRTVWRTARLEMVDLDAPGTPTPLFAQDENAGYWSAGFSPSGRSMAVFRIAGARLSLGVVDMATREVRWLGLAPDLPVADERPVWIDEDHLVYVARPSGTLPPTIQSGWGQRRLANGFDEAGRGRRPSVTLYGAGAYRDIATDYAANRVVLADVRTGVLRTLLTGAVSEIALAPGGAHLAAMLRGDVVQPDPDLPLDATFQARRLRLAIVDLPSGTFRYVCARCDLLPYLLNWSPDGRELLYFARQDGEDWQAGDLYRLPGAGGPPVRAAPELAMEIREVGANLALAAQWSGDTPIARARPRGAGGPYRWYRLDRSQATPLDAMPADQLIATSPLINLWLSQGRLVRRGHGGEQVLGGDSSVIATGLFAIDVSETGGRALFNPRLTGPIPVSLAGADGARARLYESGTGTFAWSLALPSRTARLLAVAKRGAAIGLDMDAHGVGTLFLARPGRPTILLERINRHLAAVEPARRIAIEAPGPDGHMLTHWLTLPANSGPDTPLVVLPYPGLVRTAGTPPSIDPARFSTVVNPALLAGAGYAALEPSIPLAAAEQAATITSPDGGATFNLRSAPGDDDVGERVTRCVLAAIDAAARTGHASATRVAVYGHSFGGWAALEIATHSNRFRAIIAAAGPYDYFAPYGRVSPSVNIAELGTNAGLFDSFFESGAGNVGGPPWRVPQRYLKRSPLYAADRIMTPLMLIHGDMDFMPYSSAERLLMAMHRLGRDAILLRYGGEGHVLASPANIRDEWRRIFAFLDRYIGPRSQAPMTRP